MTHQPKWKYIANLGDVNPLEFGGYFVKVDTTGVYDPEVWMLEAPSEEVLDAKWVLYRFELPKCTFQDGVLSDNKFHPEYPVWFAAPEIQKVSGPQDSTYLSDLSEGCGIPYDELVAKFCSDDVLERAYAWREVGLYWGFHEIDFYTYKMHREEAEKFVSEVLDQLKEG